MKKNILFSLILLVFSFSLFSEPAKVGLTEKEKKIAEIKYELQSTTVIENFKLWHQQMERGFKDNKPLSGLYYYTFSTAVGTWEKYQWFVADTGFSLEWLKSIKKLLDYMSKVQAYIVAEKFNGRTDSDKYKQAVKYFDVAYKRFVAKISKPEKVPLKIQRQLKVEKVKWQRAMAKKYKIKENF